MTVDDVLALFGAIVENEPDITDQDAVRALVRHGVVGSVARRVVVFAPVALARARLAGLGIRFSGSYLHAGSGECRALAGVTEFVTATEAAAPLAERCLDQLARRSPEVAAVVAGLRDVADPADLMIAPLVLTESADDR